MTYKDMGKSTGWESTLKTNAILADIYDLLQVVIVMLGGKKHKIKPYPRPSDKDDKQKIGKGALPYNELQKWFEVKRNGRRV